jgi:hypothetical protein
MVSGIPRCRLKLDSALELCGRGRRCGSTGLKFVRYGREGGKPGVFSPLDIWKKSKSRKLPKAIPRITIFSYILNTLGRSVKLALNCLNISL